MARLPRKFYARPTVLVARELLGQRLVHRCNGQRLAGLITETEAYVGEEDLACHARVGRTKRTEVMYGLPGHAYVYFNYGIHWMFNVVTQREGFPAAVLIRGIQPIEGIEAMRRHRHNRAEPLLANGPGKLAQALAIDGAFHGADLCARDAELFIEQTSAIPDSQIICGPRVGIENVPEPWRSIQWSFKWKRSVISDQ